MLARPSEPHRACRCGVSGKERACGTGWARKEELAGSPNLKSSPARFSTYPIPAESGRTAPGAAALLAALSSPAWLAARGWADPFFGKRTTRDRDKRLQLETRLIDTISSIIASKIR